MSETEIALARAYLAASGQDVVAALIRSVKDLARLRRHLPPEEIDGVAALTAERARSPRSGCSARLAY